MYPNPAGDRIVVSAEKEMTGSVVLRITDVYGKLITQLNYLDLSSINMEIDVSELPDGVYRMVFYVEDEAHVTKELLWKNGFCFHKK